MSERTEAEHGTERPGAEIRGILTRLQPGDKIHYVVESYERLNDPCTVEEVTHTRDGPVVTVEGPGGGSYDLDGPRPQPRVVHHRPTGDPNSHGPLKLVVLVGTAEHTPEFSQAFERALDSVTPAA